MLILDALGLAGELTVGSAIDLPVLVDEAVLVAQVVLELVEGEVWRRVAPLGGSGHSAKTQPLELVEPWERRECSGDWGPGAVGVVSRHSGSRVAAPV